MPEFRNDKGNEHLETLKPALEAGKFKLSGETFGFNGWSANLTQGEEKIGTIAYDCVDRNIMARIDDKVGSEDKMKELFKLLENFENSSGLTVIIAKVR